ncbi:type II toxin-antitoxin system toxin TscT [Staphylococcus epidermidis]|uniref:type II toxin-antitoxin system toxin TscT n=1 Tax=Staphylococcus epidermidis TaxID=1282 RepID=UPI00136CFEBB|nr:DUF1474 family protein [Staphylococcus epidermidis]NAM30025.1 DUF1474 family protein [Staphylococcus epidermidis]NAM67020.1 DUF1474 family protein [Staphylococcus epidermidis]NAM78571.1 DUF1474 family protein [Staphylococcus epidermidis]
MNFEQRNILCDLEVIKDKLDDLFTTYVWHGDDVFKKHRLETREEHILYSASYLENRIQHEQHAELLRVYIEELDKLLTKFREEDKKETLSAPTKVTDNEDLKKY